jgi:carbon monoxide dehydrogenase subunit G
MRFADRVVIGAPPASVWAFLLDPHRVVGCFPEVERLDRLGPTAVRATVPVRVSFLRLAVVVDVEVVEQAAAERATFRIHAAAPGTTVDGRASFELTDETPAGTAGSTLLAWSVEVEPKGLAASVGPETVGRHAEPVLRRAIDCLRRGVEAT